MRKKLVAVVVVAVVVRMKELLVKEGEELTGMAKRQQHRGTVRGGNETNARTGAEKTLGMQGGRLFFVLSSSISAVAKKLGAISGELPARKDAFSAERDSCKPPT